MCLHEEANNYLLYIFFGRGRVVLGAGDKAKRLVIQCINGVSTNPVKGRTTICQLKDLIITLVSLIFRLYKYIVLT